MPLQKQINLILQDIALYGANYVQYTKSKYKPRVYNIYIQYKMLVFGKLLLTCSQILENYFFSSIQSFIFIKSLFNSHPNPGNYPKIIQKQRKQKQNEFPYLRPHVLPTPHPLWEKCEIFRKGWYRDTIVRIIKHNLNKCRRNLVPCTFLSNNDTQRS